MLPLVRKIERGKWKANPELEVANIPSDAITSCMRTSGNNLSVWQINHDEENKIINDGILALVTGPKQENIETIDVVLLSPEDLIQETLNVIQQDGYTCVEDLVQAHRIISNLTYAKLGVIAGIILNEINDDKVERRTKSEILNIIIEALKQERLEFIRLNEKVREEIIRHCNLIGEDTDSFVKTA